MLRTISSIFNTYSVVLHVAVTYKCLPINAKVLSNFAFVNSPWQVDNFHRQLKKFQMKIRSISSRQNQWISARLVNYNVNGNSTHLRSFCVSCHNGAKWQKDKWEFDRERYPCLLWHPSSSQFFLTQPTPRVRPVREGSRRLSTLQPPLRVKHTAVFQLLKVFANRCPVTCPIDWWQC